MSNDWMNFASDVTAHVVSGTGQFINRFEKIMASTHIDNGTSVTAVGGPSAQRSGEYAVS